MTQLLDTRTVLLLLNLTEPSLRRLLRRPDAPRPEQHPSARVFLWTQADVERLAAYAKARRERIGRSASKEGDQPHV
jgi:hypothetical protein